MAVGFISQALRAVAIACTLTLAIATTSFLLFRAVDGGHHWQRIQLPWQG